MRRATRWAIGTAAAAMPVLAGASPAGAAMASDSDSASVSFTPTSGGTVNCDISAVHRVDSSSGDLEANFSAGPGLCRGTIQIQVQYVNDHGDPAEASTLSFESVGTILFVHDAGSTAVTADYEIIFENCAANCRTSLRTKTK
jgi:hypothetical protein